MGSDLQRRDDDGGSDRSAGASQRDHRAEHPELPGGARQEESTGGRQRGGRMKAVGCRKTRTTPERELWKWRGYGKRGKPKAGFPLFPSPLEISPRTGEI